MALADQFWTVVSLNQSHSETLRSGQITQIKVFQLTEWVYKFLTVAEFPDASTTAMSGDHVMTLYRNCLDWYEGFLALEEVQGNSSASFLFIQ